MVLLLFLPGAIAALWHRKAVGFLLGKKGTASLLTLLLSYTGMIGLVISLIRYVSAIKATPVVLAFHTLNGLLPQVLISYELALFLPLVVCAASFSGEKIFLRNCSEAQDNKVTEIKKFIFPLLSIALIAAMFILMASVNATIPE